MQAAEIADLISAGEGPTVAFTRERARRDDLAETLVAFANAQGGTLIMGLSGHSRAKLEGVADRHTARDLLLDAALACTPPLVLPMPREVQLDQIALLVIEIPAGLSQVYALHGKYLRREGATNQPIAPDALRRLLIERGEVSWERTIPPGSSLDELDPVKIAAYAQRLGPAAEEDLRPMLYARGCLGRGGGGEQPDRRNSLTPTNAGLHLFARQVELRHPQAEITLVHYQGREMVDRFEREDVRDTLPEAVRRAERWLNEHMRKGSRMVGLERQDWTQFPPAAVREVLVNAVAHRDYSVRGEGIRVSLFSDRLEIYSPGRLPGHVTVENIAEERFSRNESLVQILADYGLIERLGYGIDRMLRQMDAAGLPPPTFRETAAGFLVVLVGQQVDNLEPDGLAVREWVRQGLNERQIAALLHLITEQRITNRDLQDRYLDVTPETIRRDLSDLVERGMLLKVGDKRATYYILK